MFINFNLKYNFSICPCSCYVNSVSVPFSFPGVTDGAGKLDCFHPTNKQEFTDFAELLCKKINIYKAKDEFPGFVDELVKNIIVQSKLYVFHYS